MWINVDLIKRFYNTEQGKIFGNEVNETILGSMGSDRKSICIGYNLFNKMASIIPAKQGLVRGTILAHETCLPLQDCSLDEVVVIHTLEYMQDVKPFFVEVYRILKSSGKAIFMFPNVYANIVKCDEIFKFSKSVIYIEYLLKKLLFSVYKKTNLQQINRPIPGIVTALTVQKIIDRRSRSSTGKTIFVGT